MKETNIQLETLYDKYFFFPKSGIQSVILSFVNSYHPLIKISDRQHSVGLCLVTQSCPNLCNPMDYSPPGPSVHGDSQGKKTGVGCHALLKGKFSTQGSNLGRQHCKRILYCLNHFGSKKLEQMGRLNCPKNIISSRCSTECHMMWPKCHWTGCQETCLWILALAFNEYRLFNLVCSSFLNWI